MRRISFAKTRKQLEDGTKDVTRRIGWRDLQPGTVLLAVNKVMGLRPGERARVFGRIEVLSVRQEPLNRITEDDVKREGFPEMSPEDFVAFFCEFAGCEPDALVTRIEFTTELTQLSLGV